MNPSTHTTTNVKITHNRKPTAYEKTLQKEVIEAEKRFWSKNELRYQEGANEEGCPPNTIRTNIPRHNTYDPTKKFTNRRKRGTDTKFQEGEHNSPENGLGGYDQFDFVNWWRRTPMASHRNIQRIGNSHPIRCRSMRLSTITSPCLHTFTTRRI